jgi:ribonuclease HI
VIKWIPLHYNIRGNEEADVLAKKRENLPRWTYE